MKILVTGGLGYIGSHTVVDLLEKGFEVICIDNLVNSNKNVVNKLKLITNKNIKFYKIDMTKFDDLKKIIYLHPDINTIIHFAALIYVPESFKRPIDYYLNNIMSLINATQVAINLNCNFIFSSSSTVYGNSKRFPLTENMPLKNPTSPYGNTKKISEEILQDVSKKYKINVACLRYFNPIGAHPSFLIGEKPIGEPIHIMPYITQTALGIRDEVTIFGNNYNTYDGTCVRDYIHVMDVASAHAACIPFLNNTIQSKVHLFNIGRGEGLSVLDLVKKFIKYTKVKVKYKFGKRRTGDVAELWSSSKKAENLLGWKSKYSLKKMITSAWEWEKKIH